MNQNEIVLERIRKYQEEPVFHELTCRVDTCRALLKGIEEKGKVKLHCPKCSHVQENIPSMFYKDGFDEMYRQQKEILDSLTSEK